MINFQIHATNILGLGASQVVKSFLDSCNEMGYLNDTDVYFPIDGPLSNYNPKKANIIRYKRSLINAASRVYECVFSRFIFPNKLTIVLGDIPLRGIKNQIVLVHQPNLIKPKINTFSSTSLKFRINRLLFSINHKYAKKIIVQTGAMAEELILSYPKIKNKVIICPQPVPNWLNKDIKINNFSSTTKKIKLFYPAAFYPHKKHDFLLKIDKYCNFNNIELDDFEIWVTLNNDEFKPFQDIKWLKNLGRLDVKEMNLYYKKANALLFLSSMESYGLPLIEAVTVGLPVLAADFKYSRWICENQGYYFKPYEEKDFLSNLDKLLNNLKSSRLPDYSNILNKFPSSWNNVVSVFFKEIKE